MKLTNSLKAATILCLVPLAGFAQEDIDTNADGVFSYDELLVAYPDMNEDTFLAIDSNADGLVDPSEYAIAVEAGLLKAES